MEKRGIRAENGRREILSDAGGNKYKYISEKMEKNAREWKKKIEKQEDACREDKMQKCKERNPKGGGKWGTTG